MRDRQERSGRSPRATNWSSFYEGSIPAPGRYREDEKPIPSEPYPWTPDNMESKGSRAEEYT